MRRLYIIFLYLALPFILGRLFWKSRNVRAYRQRIGERLAFTTLRGPVDVWVHAVSLGEVNAAMPLIKKLIAAHKKVLVTTLTPTGSAQIQQQLGDTVLHSYLPYDFPSFLKRFIRRLQPRVLVIMETELWPNLIHVLHQKKIPVMLVNARLSDKSYKTYLRVAFFFKPILKCVDLILTQSFRDKARFIALGAEASRVVMGGNVKFDLQVRPIQNSEFQALTEKWGTARVVWIAASTHDGEEMQLLQRFRALQAEIPLLLLLIAPRHSTRFQAVYTLAMNMGFKTAKRSEQESVHTDTEVMIIDTLGELSAFYTLSHYAFVGGTFVPIGGHNVLEPIAEGVPVFCGPYVQNTQAVCDMLLEAGAMHLVPDADVLVQKIMMLHHNPAQRMHQVEQAFSVWRDNQGAVDRALTEIEALLTKYTHRETKIFTSDGYID